MVTKRRIFYITYLFSERLYLPMRLILTLLQTQPFISFIACKVINRIIAFKIRKNILRQFLIRFPCKKHVII